jgi:hypothetical protein
MMNNSVIGYESDERWIVTDNGNQILVSDDEFNKPPKFCGKCGRELKSLDKQDRFDVYTGEPLNTTYLVCKTLNSTHDIWQKEAYGAWVQQ